MHGELIPLGRRRPDSAAEEESARRAPRELRHRPAVFQRLGPSLPADLQRRLLVRQGPARAATASRSTASRVTEKRLDPGDELSIAKHRYDVRYSPHDLGAVGPPPVDEEPTDVMKQSLLGAGRPGSSQRQAAADRRERAPGQRALRHPGRQRGPDQRSQSARLAASVPLGTDSHG